MGTVMFKALLKRYQQAKISQVRVHCNFNRGNKHQEVQLRRECSEGPKASAQLSHWGWRWELFPQTDVFCYERLPKNGIYKHAIVKSTLLPISSPMAITFRRKKKKRKRTGWPDYYISPSPSSHL